MEGKKGEFGKNVGEKGELGEIGENGGSVGEGMREFGGKWGKFGEL